MATKTKTVKSEKNDLIKKNIPNITEAGFLVQSLHNSTRQRVMSLLLANNKLTVQELYTKTRTEQSIMSQHLAILRQANLVKTKRSGRFIFYSANKDRLKDLLRFAKEVVQL